MIFPERRAAVNAKSAPSLAVKALSDATRHPWRRRRRTGDWRPPARFSLGFAGPGWRLSLIHISEPTRLGMISYAVFCLKKKKKTTSRTRTTGRQSNSYQTHLENQYST